MVRGSRMVYFRRLLDPSYLGKLFVWLLVLVAAISMALAIKFDAVLVFLALCVSLVSFFELALVLSSVLRSKIVLVWVVLLLMLVLVLVKESIPVLALLLMLALGLVLSLF